ncbi:MAG: SRPBCC family protein [Actinomycetota bacterium]|nr:SRPBCC family protein [Actinomycetota bacterium]
MRAYRFSTTWVLEADRERVWDAVYESERWPEWWRGVIRTERLADGDADGIGQRGVYEWRARLPYTVRFEIVSTVVRRPFALGGDASGELSGSGLWRFFSEGNSTAVVYDWNVRTQKPWMNALGPLAKPILRSNHDWVMRNGGEGLGRRLGARLLVNA